MKPGRPPGPLPPSRPSRLVLIGFMGAGKSTTGALVARALGWKFVDMDDEVARHAGTPVPEVIRSHGLASFRQMEAAAGRRALALDRVVVAAGGGWASVPGRVAQVRDIACTVWLQVCPATALARIAASGASRPLLEDVPDPLAAAEALLAGRTPHYALSDITIDTEGRSPEEVALEVLERAGLAPVESGDGKRNHNEQDGREKTA